MRRYVTGTDTGVGKSAATAALAAAARAAGRDVRAVKLVATGAPPGEPGEDATLIAAAAGHAPLVGATWAAPLSPHRAAALEARPLDVPALLRWLETIDGDPILIEGAGGWRVPFAATGGDTFELRDVARRLPGDVLVVAADRLGVINHTRLTVEAVRADGLRVAAVILNRGVGDPADPARRTNLDDLRLLLDVPVLVLPTVDPTDRAALAAAGAALLDGIDRVVASPSTEV